MKKFVAELIGTFMLVFIGTGAVVLEMVLMVLDTLELLLPLVWQLWLQPPQSELFQVLT